VAGVSAGLPLALLAASAIVALSAARTISGMTGSLLTLTLGVIIGWLLSASFGAASSGPESVGGYGAKAAAAEAW
jgi:hypothetical protein